MMARARRIAAYGIAFAVLAGVFALYTRPEMMVGVSEMIWSCFR